MPWRFGRSLVSQDTDGTWDANCAADSILSSFVSGSSSPPIISSSKFSAVSISSRGVVSWATAVLRGALTLSWCVRNCTEGLCVELLAELGPGGGLSSSSAAAGRNVVGAGTGVVASERSARSMCLAMASVRRSSYCAMRCLPASV